MLHTLIIAQALYALLILFVVIGGVFNSVKMKAINEWFKKRRLEKIKNKESFDKIMKRFDTVKYTRKDINQGDRIKVEYRNETYYFMYLYSHLDEDYFLRLKDNVIVVCPTMLVNAP